MARPSLTRMSAAKPAVAQVSEARTSSPREDTERNLSNVCSLTSIAADHAERGHGVYRGAQPRLPEATAPLLLSCRSVTPFLRRLLPYLTVVLAIVGIYDGVTFYQRWRGIRADQAQQAAEQQAEAKKTIDSLGGDQLKILTFYAMPGSIHPGESARMCYGVNAAKKVTITPPVGTDVYPAYSRCLQISPKATTEYTLTAEDGAGNQLKQH